MMNFRKLVSEIPPRERLCEHMERHRLPKLRRFSAVKQRRLDALLEKNSEGTITPKEKLTLERLVAEAERLMVANARRLAKFTASQTADAPPSAMPVTVWVKPEPARR